MTHSGGGVPGPTRGPLHHFSPEALPSLARRRLQRTNADAGDMRAANRAPVVRVVPMTRILLIVFHLSK